MVKTERHVSIYGRHCCVVQLKNHFFSLSLSEVQSYLFYNSNVWYTKPSCSMKSAKSPSSDSCWNAEGKVRFIRGNLPGFKFSHLKASRAHADDLILIAPFTAHARSAGFSYRRASRHLYRSEQQLLVCRSPSQPTSRTPDGDTARVSSVGLSTNMSAFWSPRFVVDCHTAERREGPRATSDRHSAVLQTVAAASAHGREPSAIRGRSVDQLRTAAQA